MSRAQRMRAFTLLEVLVALTIIAVALAAAFRGASLGSDGANLLQTRTLAQWVAQNRLALTQLQRPWPPIGEQSGSDSQASRRYVWRQTVSGTPNPALRKVEITVSEEGVADWHAARIIGYVAEAGAP
jgi:general secretion pathway protein I